MDEAIEHKVEQIDRNTEKIKKLEDKYETLKLKEVERIDEKKQLSQYLLNIEEKREKKLQKLEKLKSLFKQEFEEDTDINFKMKQMVGEFQIKTEDAFNHIPLSPLDGLREIDKSLSELKTILSDDNRKKNIVKFIIYKLDLFSS